MTKRTRLFSIILLALPVAAFYGLLIFPWNFENRRGLGWLMLGVLYLVMALCLLSALVCSYLTFKDERKVIWLILGALNLVPLIHGIIIPILAS